MKNIPGETIKKAATGDMKAFRAIYNVASSYVYTVSMKVTHNKEDAEEVTQDVFLSLYRNLAKFQFRSSFKTWLYRITLNKAINKLKKRNRHTKRSVEYESEKHDIFVAKAENAKDDKEYNEKIVEDLLKVLPPDQKACIILRNVQGLSYKEISQILKINLNTVRTRLKRAREKLIEYVKSKEKSYDLL
jgi:RNA polymerase sigma-70 factor (ECF subfamily)